MKGKKHFYLACLIGENNSTGSRVFTVDKKVLNKTNLTQVKEWHAEDFPEAGKLVIASISYLGYMTEEDYYCD